MAFEFEGRLREWAEAACDAWGYPAPPASFIESTLSRLTAGLAESLERGVAEGIIMERGHQFVLEGLAPGKGPYSWFSRSGTKVPVVNWEYFPQVAEYVRLVPVAARNGLKLRFEDELMDIALYRDDRLVICCEVKERSRQLGTLLSGIRQYESGIDWDMPDRGNDPLRKAKYLSEKKPDYLYLMSIGGRREFAVSFPNGREFQLVETLIPYI